MNSTIKTGSHPSGLGALVFIIFLFLPLILKRGGRFNVSQNILFKDVSGSLSHQLLLFWKCVFSFHFLNKIFMVNIKL